MLSFELISLLGFVADWLNQLLRRMHLLWHGRAAVQDGPISDLTDPLDYVANNGILFAICALG